MKSYWRKVTPAEMEERKRRERDRLIRQAKAKFDGKGLTDWEVYTLRTHWKLTEVEIATHWEVYPCQLNWAIRRGGCGCTARGPQFCLKDRTKDEILEILPDCR